MNQHPKADMIKDLLPYMAVRVDPDDMVQYVHNLMLMPHSSGPRQTPGSAASDVSVALARRLWGGDTPQARAAQLRWSALNRAFGDARLSTWTTAQKRDQIHVPAALIAAAGVARLTMAEDEVVFDIPTLLDATLQLCEPVGHA
jgi:hypothetical protein